jgi:hypothetical protein
MMPTTVKPRASIVVQVLDVISIVICIFSSDIKWVNYNFLIQVIFVFKTVASMCCAINKESNHIVGRQQILPLLHN